MLSQQQVNTYITDFVKSVSKIDILVHKFPRFCCILDSHWSALSSGKRLLQVCYCQWKNMTWTILLFNFIIYFHFMGLDSWHSNFGLVTKLRELLS